MNFYDVVAQVVQLLQQQGRVTYRGLQFQFKLDDETLETLKEELLFSHPVVDEGGRGLVWSRAADVIPSQANPTEPHPAAQQGRLARTDAPPAGTTAPDAERRQLTVMFCDLADSTRLSGQLDPEDLRDVIRAYQATGADVIQRYDGYIAQHLGDGLMVYFGWPQAHEDDARRAVYAGLGIVEAMQALNTRLEQEKGIRLAVRIGIHTGLVVLGEIGQGASQEHLALGETPNVASRIEGVAQPGTVAISDATFQLVQVYFVCEDLGQHTLRGVDDAQQVHRVVRASDVQGGFDVAAVRRLTPLVGRETETSLLFERWQRVKEGQGQVVLLSGEAGIGKSRLLQVLRDHIAGEPHARLECRSSPYYQNTALYPITDLFRRALRWQPDDTSAARLGRLQQMLSRYQLETEETVPLFAALLSLPLPEDRYRPLNLSSQRQRQRTLETIVAMLLQQSEQQPLLLIMEDLHWADPTTLELLDLLIEQTPTTSILTLLTCRPTFQPTWSHRSYLTGVTVNRLSGNQIERMAEQVAGEIRLPDEVLQQIVDKTDGVPLYVEEMTKAILESETLKQVNDHYKVAVPFSALAIPPTLQDSLMARLDRLVTAKGVAQIGATIGRQFAYQLLLATAQVDEATLRRQLGQLIEAELLYQRGLPPQATYTFKHALIQDAAYQSLLKRTRQQYHQRIARVLQAQFPETVETQPELLAHHCTEAGQHEEASRYWQQAGQRALERSAHLEAVAHLSKGLDVLKNLPDTAKRTRYELDLQTALGPALMATKGYAAPEVEQAYVRALELCKQVGESSQLFPALWGLWVFYFSSAGLQTAQHLAEQLLALAQRRQAPGLLLQAHQAMGQTLFLIGEFTAARAQLDQGIALYDRQQHRAQAFLYGSFDAGVVCLSYASWALWSLGYSDQAVQRIQEALTLARALCHPPSLAAALTYAAFLHMFRRDVQTVQARAEAAINLCAEHGLPFWLAVSTFHHGWGLAAQGQFAEGIAQMRQGLADRRAMGTELFLPAFLAVMAEAYGNMGQPVEGLSLLDAALAAVHSTSEHSWEAELCRLRGELLLHAKSGVQHAPLTAEDCFQQALAIARQQQAKSWELRAATSLARLWQSQGRQHEAYELLQPIYGWFTEGLDTADLQQAKVLLRERDG